jgi:hypothetical protein
MAIFDLITVDRAIQNATLAALNATNPAYLQSLIDAVSDSICRYCCRDFTQQTYQDYMSIDVVQCRVPILIRQYPVVQITRVALAVRALQVQNSNNTTNQRATVQVDTNGVNLFTVASAVPTTVTLSFADYPTIQAMANAINAVGNGWTTAIWSGANGSYALWPSADLKPMQGAVTTFLGGSYLELYEDTYTSSMIGDWWDDGDGPSTYSSSGPGWRLQGDTGEMYFKCRRGSLNLRIDYEAGYATIPASVQEACVQLIQWTYQNSNVNLAMKSAKIEDYSYTLSDTAAWPTSVLLTLNLVKAWDRLANY